MIDQLQPDPAGERLFSRHRATDVLRSRRLHLFPTNQEIIMADPNTGMAPASLSDLPILPTGSGIADLEVAYEQMKLADDADDAESTTMAGVEADDTSYDPAMTPTEGGSDTAESAAHPS